MGRFCMFSFNTKRKEKKRKETEYLARHLSTLKDKKLERYHLWVLDKMGKVDM